MLTMPRLAIRCQPLQQKLAILRQRGESFGGNVGAKSPKSVSLPIDDDSRFERGRAVGGISHLPS